MSTTMYHKKIDYCLETILERESLSEVEFPCSTMWPDGVDRVVAGSFRYLGMSHLGHLDQEAYLEAPSAPPINLLVDLLS